MGSPPPGTLFPCLPATRPARALIYGASQQHRGVCVLPERIFRLPCPGAPALPSVLSHVPGDPAGEHRHRGSQRAGCPTAHTHVLLPGQPLHPGRLLHVHFCAPDAFPPALSPEDHLRSWLRAPDVSESADRLHRVSAACHHGLRSLPGHLPAP